MIQRKLIEDHFWCTSAQNAYRSRSPAWSPIGQVVYFIAHRGQGVSGLYHNFAGNELMSCASSRTNMHYGNYSMIRSKSH